MVTYNQLRRLKGVDARTACRILDVISGATKPLVEPSIFPETCAWAMKCYHTPRGYALKEAAVAELLGTTAEALEVECAPSDRFEGIRIGQFVCGYANAGDPYVNTVILSYRALTTPPHWCIGRPGASEEDISFEEGEWYIGCWGDVLEAAEWTFRPEDESEEPEEEDDDGE